MTDIPVPDWLYEAVSAKESNNDPGAVSPKGAVGTMQTMPGTLRDPGYGVVPAQDDSDGERTRVGYDYLHAMLNKYNGDVPKALSAYNWGPQNMDEHLAGNKPTLPAETSDYVTRIMKKAPQIQMADAGNIQTDATVDNSPPQTRTVVLPNGTKIYGVPTDMSKEDFKKKAMSNGIDIDSMIANMGKPKMSEDSTTPFVHEAKEGLKAAGSLISDDYKFATGQQLDKDPTPMQDTLRQKVKDGTWNRHDVEKAFLEGMGQSPGGKFMTAAAGMIPEANVVTTAVNRWINPEISRTTGIAPEDLQLGEMAAIPAAMKGAKMAGISKPSDLPLTEKAGSMAMSPLETTGNAIKVVTAPARMATRPIVRGILEGDNPITGEPGLKSAMDSPTAAEGTRLEQNIPGLQFTAGAKTGDASARGIEDALANSARWGDRFNENITKNVQAITGKFNDTLNSIYSKPVPQEEFGGRLSDAYNKTLTDLSNTRRAQAKIDFDSAYQGSDDAGRYIQSNNLFRTLQELRDEGNARLLTSSKALGGKMANKYLNSLATKTKSGNEMADNLTIKELGNGLSDFGESAGDYKIPDAERRVYTRLYSALQKDLDAEIDNPKGDPQRAGMLAIARDNYGTLTNHMADIQKSTLGNMVGYAQHDSQGRLLVTPESLANKFNTLQPSELRSTLQFLDKNHPDLAQTGRRYMLQSVLEKAQSGAGMRGVGTTKPFAKAEFVKNLPDPNKLNVLLNDPKAASDITDIAAATNRLIDWGAQKSNSATAQRTDMLNKLMSYGKGALVRSIVSDNLAQDLLNPSNRRSYAVQARQWMNQVFEGQKDIGLKSKYSIIRDREGGAGP